MAERLDYAPSAAERKALTGAFVKASARAGAQGGRVGGVVSGAGKVSGAAGAAGGVVGAAVGGRLLPNNTGQRVIQVAVEPGEFLEHVSAVLARLGTEVEDPNGERHEHVVWGVVGGGWFNMNPALVRVEVNAPESASTRVVVRATAKEGLIKQRAGEKVADRVADALVSA